ncbi:MAG: c-type cytochrome [Chloroflexaceae bacterium]|nr:c-type cytochrome [Chloroflexaceae bacterium]
MVHIIPSRGTHLILIALLLVSVLGITTVASVRGQNTLDAQLQEAIATHGITALAPAPASSAAQIELGRLLFFDKLLSGNRDIACATCHHPTLASGDGLCLPVGTGGVGLGPDRKIGHEHRFVPRNAPEIFNRGDPLWTSQFWDSRMTRQPDGSINSPAGAQLPGVDVLDTVLTAQAMFPVTSRDEMRGKAGDVDIYGQPNEIALLDDTDFSGIWQALMTRVLAVPAYVDRFALAYPDVPVEELGFEHAARAIGVFEADAFTLLDSPWDRYLRGDMGALSDDAKRGALLFYGDAGCVSCHSGPLMTDQQHHNIAVPQLGPGKGAESPLDYGHGRETGVESDYFTFRTPPLRNVSVTGPYMHNGAYHSLEAVIEHHGDPATALQTFDVDQHLPTALRDTCQDDPALIATMLSNVDPLLQEPLDLSAQQVADLVAFLEALTDPAVADLEQMIPATVPSGLPVQDTVEWFYLPLIRGRP